jgi:hypothetical protein
MRNKLTWCCGLVDEMHCSFDHGIHQFYEGHYLEDKYTFIKDRDVDVCQKCGVKKMLSSDKALHIDEDRR